MEKKYWKGEKGIIDQIKEMASKRPSPIHLEPFRESGLRALHVLGCIFGYRFDLAMKKQKIDDYVAGIKSGSMRTKVKKLLIERQEIEPSRGQKAQLTLRKNQAMNAMIRDGVWNKDLADYYNISKKDIQHHHSVEIRMQVLMNIEVEQEFKQYIAQKALAAYKIENAKSIAYTEGLNYNKAEGGLLRKLISVYRFEKDTTAPRLWIENVLFGGSGSASSIFSLHEELESYWTETIAEEEQEERRWYKYATPITQHEYRRQVERLEKLIHITQKERARLFGKLFLDKEGNENITYIKAIGINRLETYIRDKQSYDEGIKPYKPALPTHPLKVTSTGQGEALIGVYVNWYNKTFEEQINADRQIEETLKTTIRNDKRRIENRTLKQERDRTIIELFLSGCTKRTEIARIVDVADRTVREIVERYLRVVEAYDKGHTVAEHLSELTGTKLRLIILYIEIHTQNSIELRTLTALQQQELQQQQQEEQFALEEIREREVRNLEKEIERRVYREKVDRILAEHKRGLNPSAISKRLSMQITFIRQALRAEGLQPVFDPRTASKKEREIWESGKEEREIQSRKEQKERIAKALPILKRTLNSDPHKIYNLLKHISTKKLFLVAMGVVLPQRTKRQNPQSRVTKLKKQAFRFTFQEYKKKQRKLPISNESIHIRESKMRLQKVVHQG